MRIVILDDSSTNRSIYIKLAQSLHADVETKGFADPHAALSWLKQYSVDLIITDFKMPTMTGADFVGTLRADGMNSDTPVIVVTAYDDKTFRMQALEAGATDFLLIPVDHYEFIARARNLLQLGRQQKLIISRSADLEERLVRSEEAHAALLRNSRESLAQVVDTVPALISAADREGNCVFVNESFAKFAGVSQAVESYVALLGPARAEECRRLDRIVFETGTTLASREEVLVDRNGAKRTFLVTRAPLRDPSNNVVSVLMTSTDIDERKRTESHLHHMAHHDALTKLPNRVLLYQRLEHAIAGGRRGDRMFALHFIDLDRFKSINDGLGHHVGDRLLTAVAKRLSACVREYDTVARLGGDEFAIIQCGINGPEDAGRLASRVADYLATPVRIDEQELNVSASIGITMHPSDGHDADTLLRNADLAMYQAKAAGRSTYSFFAAAMGPHARESMQLESDLRQGLARGDFYLVYQPQIDLISGRIVGAEALLRWRRPGHGNVSPGLFLHLAEETGLILPIGAWVLKEACQQSMRWQQAGGPPIRMAINVSPVQFKRQDVYSLVAATLADTGLPAWLLDLELTESMLLDETGTAVALLERLTALGVQLSVDDFGTGYSSLSYVKNLPVCRLKIDQSFVVDLSSNPNDQAIVRATIDLGRSLRLSVVAEGVETEAQARRLMDEGCDEAQGFYFSRPVSADAFAQLLQSGVRALPTQSGAAAD
jgi:diguanylate cyclase (GGDEF)-like protein/PAS domain S-box-containing protein